VTATSVDFEDDTAVTITGTKAVALGEYNIGKSLDASALTGKLTVDVDLDQGSVTTFDLKSGTADDDLTVDKAGVKFSVDAGNGDNTVTITNAAAASSVSTGTGSDTINLNDVDALVIVTGAGDDTVVTSSATDAIIVMGDGTADKLDVNGNADLDLSSNVNFAVTGVEVIDITGIDTDGSAASVGTLTVSAAQFANDNTFKITGDSAVDDIFKVLNTGSAGTTIDASNITFDSTQAAKLVLQGKNSTATTVIQDIVTGSSKNDTIVASTGGDIMDGGAGTDTLDLSGLDNVANVEGTSTGTTTGVVLNLGATAVTNTAILTATGDYTADSVTTVSGGTLAYLFNASASTNSAVTGTVSNIESVIGSDLGDYIVAHSGGTTIDGGTGVDYLVGGVGVDTFVYAAGDTGQTAATADVIKGYATTSDIIDVTGVTLSLVAEGVATGAGQAAIAADGTVTFHADDDTFAEQIIAVEAGMTAATAVAGETAIFADAADAANSYIFISDGVAGVGANDILIQIVGDAAGALTIASGNITAIA
jgi:hypothetical protein